MSLGSKSRRASALSLVAPAVSSYLVAVKIRVRCFASVRELLGADVVEVELPEGATLAALKLELAERAPDLLRLPLTQAVNRRYATADQQLADGDEVAFIPPISGGDSTPDGARYRFDFVDGPLDPRALEAECRSDRDGAIVTFSGVTRDHNDGRSVEHLSYEAYTEMAHSLMEGILAELSEGMAIGRVRVAHRLGDVPIGEASVVVVVAAAHRGAAFDACRTIMDRLKVELPIFKKEWFADSGGGSRWVGDLPRG